MRVGPAFDAVFLPTYIVQVTLTDSHAAGRPDPADQPGPLERPVPTDRSALLREITDGVAAAASRHRCAAARRVHHSGISLGHLQILWILQEHGPLPVTRLADWLGIGAPNATGLLDRMEQRGLVERVRDAEDRRVVLARETALGREAVVEHDGWRDELVEQVLGPLDDESLAAIVRRLRDLEANAPSEPAAPAAPCPPDRGATPR